VTIGGATPGTDAWRHSEEMKWRQASVPAECMPRDSPEIMQEPEIGIGEDTEDLIQREHEEKEHYQKADGFENTHPPRSDRYVSAARFLAGLRAW
jgi:hypothetical protein